MPNVKRASEGRLTHAGEYHISRWKAETLSFPTRYRSASADSIHRNSEPRRARTDRENHDFADRLIQSSPFCSELEGVSRISWLRGLTSLAC